MTILLVEDDDQFRGMLELMLTKAQYQVISASNAQAGLKLIQTNQPDLILTDVIMPTMDGIELIMTLKRRGDTTPVIVMSGGGRSMSTEGNFMTVSLLGATATIAKPFSREQLLQAIEDALPDTVK